MSAVCTTVLLQDQAVDHIQIMTYIKTTCMHTSTCHFSTDYVISSRLKNVEYFNYVDNMITDDARCTREIKSRSAVAKIEFNKKNVFFSNLFLDLRQEHSFACCWNLDTSENRSKIRVPSEFLNVVLARNGEDQLDISCGIWRSVTKGQVGEEHSVYNRMKEG
jgi:hypothetical protein